MLALDEHLCKARLLHNCKSFVQLFIKPDAEFEAFAWVFGLNWNFVFAHTECSCDELSSWQCRVPYSGGLRFCRQQKRTFTLRGKLIKYYGVQYLLSFDDTRLNIYPQ